LKKNPAGFASLLAAAKMDDDYKKNLLPIDFQNWNQITNSSGTKLRDYETADLPPFIKAALTKIVKDSQNKP
jgi:hypothetical protein